MNETLEQLQSLVEVVLRSVESDGELNQRYGDEVLAPLVGELLGRALSEIDGEHRFDGNRGNLVFHYTGVKTVEALVRGIAHLQSASLRLYNSGDFNDPDEGEFFTRNLALPTSNRWILEGNTSHSYVASFVIPDATNDLSDDLRFWRSYGKDGEGCSLALNIPLDRLRNVLYGVRHVKRVRPILFAFLDILRPLAFVSDRRLRPSIRRCLATGVWNALAGIKYLYKSEAYCYENECRVVVPESVVPREEIKFQCDEKGEILPVPKHYVEDPDLESVRILATGSRIVLGPSVKGRDNLRFYLETLKRLTRRAGSDPRITASQIVYRRTG